MRTNSFWRPGVPIVKIEKLRMLCFLLPLISALVTTGIVWNQSARRDRLMRELAQMKQEFDRLLLRLPKGAPTPAEHPDHDHDGEDDHPAGED